MTQFIDAPPTAPENRPAFHGAGMKTFLLLLALAAALSIGALLLWRQFDQRADRAMWQRLQAGQTALGGRFHPDMVADLPDAARRFFLFSIAPGTELRRVAGIEMRGKFGMGDAADPKYLDMEAQQVLAAPDGFIWKMRAGSGLVRISGSDSHEWTRFRVLGLLPVARAGGAEDHRRSAFARLVSEALFWSPAALLPGPGVDWEEVGENSAQVTLRHDGLAQSVVLEVAEDGRPLSVSMQRGSDANPDKTFRLQPFGGTLSQFQDFEGYRLATHVEAGNFFDTDDYFPFFIADVEDIAFPARPD